jgi:hypothetical protein
MIVLFTAFINSLKLQKQNNKLGFTLRTSISALCAHQAAKSGWNMNKNKR